MTREPEEATNAGKVRDLPARILVVDDESDLEILFRQMFRREIRKKELSFTFVHNGQQALDKLEEDDDFDMVLSDIRMPQMDGLTLLSKLNKNYPILKAVMVTAYGDMENIRKAMNGGAFDFISKPIQYQDLKTTIYKTLTHVKELRELHQAREEKERAQAMLVAELQKLDRMKDEFLANTSHELRTPLNGIIGIVESLITGATGELNERTKKNLDLVLQSGRRLAHLVNDILDFSKLKKENLTLHRELVGLRPLIDMVFQLSSPMARAKSIDLVNALPVDLPEVYGDEDRIQQIAVNLIGNAIKFTEKGSVTALARIEGDFIRISIKDTGIGIPEDKQSQIFEAFSQGEGAATRAFDGTGLGLSITRKLVSLHGGTLEVESQPDVGSTFSFVLPMSKETADKAVAEMAERVPAAPKPVLHAPPAVSPEPPKPREPAARMEPARVETPSPAPEPKKPKVPAAQPMLREEKDTGGAAAEEPLPARRKGKDQYHILVVDDNPINIQVLVNHLQDYQITTATGGKQALDLVLGDEVFDLILLDVMMPGMNGYEVCQRIRKRFNPNELPVLLLTAKNQTKDLITGLEAGANDYITKPFAMKELMARVKTHLELADLTRELKEAQSLALEHARAAGKAEFATSVLHNVGNILSSIKVSCTQITMKLNQSKVTGFYMAAKMLEQNIEDIGRFLSEDPKGRKLPEYFIKLADILQKEGEVVTKELENMRKRIFLMEDTIETQQYYAKDSNEIVPVVLENLVDESLAVQSELIRKHQIEVEKVYRYDGTVSVHQSVLIQILVNIIKNGIEAMNQSEHRLLTVEIGKDENTQVFCRISDTGEGIKELDKLFQHGYSTKMDGHGFGLHYCLQAMENMNGTLHAESEGEGKGASFVLRFPPQAG
ncbi:MAG: response regulator [Acidobacteriota bacterium]|nr:response regulator [Acidobacteriota bacterium]